MTVPKRKLAGDLMSAGMILALSLGIVIAASATTLDDYKERVESARVLASQVEESIGDEEAVGVTPTDLASKIRQDFPASERIEWEGGTVETASQWLLDKAAAVEEQKDPQKQRLLISEIREYLSTISFKLHELDQLAAAERTKDQDKQKLGEILRREEYQKPQEKQESAIQRWFREFLEWLEDLFPKPSAQPQGVSGTGFLTTLFQVLLYAALLGLLGFIVYKIAPLIFPKLRRPRTRKSKKQRTILGESLGEDVTAIDLFAEAERLAREGNLRGAIRKGYIALLCDLSDRKVIGLAGNKTNRDYLRDVRSRRDLHSRLNSVTDMFERHWYGFQESADQDWAKFRDEYKEAIRSV
jgi:hypothetical protein